MIPSSTPLFENLGKSKNYKVILFLLSSFAKKEFYRIKQFSRENNSKVFSITLKGTVVNRILTVPLMKIILNL